MEKYLDIYDVSDTDISDAISGYSETDFDDYESLRALKIFAAKFHIIRKIFLCSLMALDVRGEKTDFLRWRTAVDQIHVTSLITREAGRRLHLILTEEESTY